MDSGASDRCSGAASRWRRMCGVALAAMVTTACGSPYYTSAPIEAWVVDAETGAPIEGAVVTANWQLRGFTLDTGGSRNRQLEVMETTTDSTGKFRFPGFTKINFGLDELGDEDPRILIFKPGYKYGGGKSSYPNGDGRGVKRVSQLIGKQFAMMKSDNDMHQRAKDLRALSTNLMPIWSGGDNSKAAKMLGAIACEAMRIQALEPKEAIPIFGEPDAQSSCR